MKMISLKVSELPFELKNPLHPHTNVYVGMSSCGSLMIENQWGQHIEDFEPNLFEEDWFNNLPKDRFFELEETQVKYTIVGVLRDARIPIPGNIKDDELVMITMNNVRMTVHTTFYSHRLEVTADLKKAFDNILAVNIR